MIERHRITTFGVSPTAIRVLMRHGAELPGRYDLSSLRLLGSTGEPWDESSYLWFFENVGKRRLPVHQHLRRHRDHRLFPVSSAHPAAEAMHAGRARAGHGDRSGGRRRPSGARGTTGYLVCTKPAPSMTRGIWGDPERYLETYWSRWPGFWYHGDWASVDEDGCWFLHGRADESMNVAGRKVGPAEVEQALMEHPLVSEAVVDRGAGRTEGRGDRGFRGAKDRGPHHAGIRERHCGPRGATCLARPSARTPWKLFRNCPRRRAERWCGA